MPTSLEQIQKQIVALERQAEKLKQQEIAGVVDRIKEAIRAYGLTASDLGLGRGRSLNASGPVAKARHKGQYRDPATGKTWSGRGRRPQWFVEAITTGRKPEELRA